MKREIKEDEIALTYSPDEGLRLELPHDEMPIGIDGALLAGIYIRLEQDGEWAEELKRWVMSEVPGLSVN
jgi:hypothetical protein